jgi:prepilin-type processing-associated H-X9-DG protein
VQSAREAARRAQCTNNLKQIGLAVHNYHSTHNCFPPMTMILGPTNDLGWGWNAGWGTLLLPNLEQQPLFNAYNFSVNADNVMNTTVTYNALATFLCPSETQKIRPLAPYAPTCYAANHGGPGVIRMWSGTIVHFYTTSHEGDQLNGWPAGTAWWGADGNLGFFGFESVTDGTSNTGLFSEKLLGWPAGTANGVLTAGSKEGRRGTYVVDVPVNYNSGDSGAAMRGVQLCQAVPGNTQAYVDSWVSGFSWAMAAPWQITESAFYHYNTPNKLSCGSQNDPGGWHGGTSSLVTASSFHPGGVNECFADGSVRFIKDSVSPQVWWAIGSRNQGETISADSF